MKPQCFFSKGGWKLGFLVATLLIYRYRNGGLQRLLDTDQELSIWNVIQVE